MEPGTTIILVVEDEFVIRADVVAALIYAGFETIEADHADVALSILANRFHEIHALFTDIHIPGASNGLELAHHTKRSWPWIALLIASGRARPLPHELPLESRFLPKPYDTNRVVAHLRELTRLH